MTSVSQASPSPGEQAHRDELAGAKLWSFHVSAAEKYDTALVEGWRSDMEGLLIFAGLFSASLTAFLIESYKTLNPDQGRITLAILAQISHQLQGGSNVSAVDLPAMMNVRPTSAAIICNTLWFLSLGFSLACALIATLVRQWSRHYIYSSDLKQSPIIRARIFAYLYFGVERFGLSALVQFIPLLLHTSLLLFFCGLTAFLQPINAAVTTVAATLLASISISYIYLTVSPLFSSDSPFRTPLSNFVWWCTHHLQAMLGWRWSPDEEAAFAFSQSASQHKSIPTMFDVMAHDATHRSDARTRRDGRAITWAVRCLTDEGELEPLVEAIPELVWGPTGRRTLYDNTLNVLLETSDLRLVPRIEALFRDCDTGLLAPDLQNRRRIFCIKALWAFACFSVSQASTRPSSPVFDHYMLAAQLTSVNVTPEMISHLISAYALVRCSDLCSLLSCIRAGIPMLEKIGSTSDVVNILRGIQNRAADLSFSEFDAALEQLVVSQSTNTASLVGRSLHTLKLCSDLAYDILAEYLRSCASLKQISYHFEATWSMIQQVSPRPRTIAAMKLKETFITIIETNAERIAQHQTIHPLDLSLDVILHLLQGIPQCMDDVKLLRVFLGYMSTRAKTEQVWAQMFPKCDPEFMGSLLTKGLAVFDGRQRDAALAVVWFSCSRVHRQFALFNTSTVTAIQGSQESFLSSCTVAVIKADMLRRASRVPPLTSYAMHPRLSEQQKEGFCTILLEFLESRGKFPPNDGEQHLETETFNILSVYVSSTASFSLLLQRRFANSFFNILNGDSHSLMASIIKWIGRASSGSPPIQRFDDPDARATILEASRTFLTSPAFGHLAQTDIPGIVDALIAELASDTSAPTSDAPVDPRPTTDDGTS
ncbi:hypothetical protein C8R45DRAFT_966461 [Mycena sanguinolenta]|nr:hypothetical protein C8R45DRAFT_966461 [Mycena sanguinolenta]